jgi:hypothetical protein
MHAHARSEMPRRARRFLTRSFASWHHGSASALGLPTRRLERMKRLLLAVLCISLLGVGCGGDDDDDSNGGADGGAKSGSPSTPVDVKKMITADEGGEVKAGKAALSIPAGALSEDTEISVTTVDADDLPSSGDVASDAYDFGPDGTTFEKPVTLTLEFAGKAPKDMAATLAWLDGDEWTPLADSKVSGGKVTATTTHFTTFAVVWVSTGDGGGDQAAGQCTDDVDTSCGGDLLGTWEFGQSCLTLPPDILQSDPDNEALADCKGIVVAANLDQSGTITFKADKTYELHSKQTGTVEASIPKSCLMGADCPADAKSTPDACELEITSIDDQNDETGTYAIDSNKLTLTGDDDDSDDAETPAEFCVKGGTVTVKITDEDGTVQVFTATKK